MATFQKALAFFGRIFVVGVVVVLTAGCGAAMGVVGHRLQLEMQDQIRCP